MTAEGLNGKRDPRRAIDLGRAAGAAVLIASLAVAVWLLMESDFPRTMLMVPPSLGIGFLVLVAAEALHAEGGFCPASPFLDGHQASS